MKRDEEGRKRNGRKESRENAMVEVRNLAGVPRSCAQSNQRNARLGGSSLGPFVRA